MSIPFHMLTYPCNTLNTVQLNTGYNSEREMIYLQNIEIVVMSVSLSVYENCLIKISVQKTNGPFCQK